MSNQDPDSLLDEKSLFAIYLRARKIQPSRTSVISTILFVGLATFQAFFWGDDTKLIVEVRELAQFGFGFALATLGFLIAGYSIITATGRPSMYVELHDHTHDSGLTYLKYYLFVYLQAFIYFLVFLFTCLIIMAFGSTNGLASHLIQLSDNPEFLRSFLIRTAWVTVVSGLFMLIVQLMMFIYNVHHGVMTIIRWAFHEDHEK